MKSSIVRILTIVFAFMTAPTVHAGPYTDDLSKCLVESTTPETRMVLVKWLFMALSQHPAITSFGTFPDSEWHETSQGVADLLVRLLTESCPKKAQAALQYEGRVALQSSLQVFGTIAGTELFTNPVVAGA
ncbi:MAG: hypothetical protein JSU59_07780, partial [Nitrospirota bacterium]